MNRANLATLRAAIAARDPEDPALAAWLAPEYPKVATTVACWLRAGESPQQIAAKLGGDLSRSEAHAWLSTAPSLSPAEWLCKKHGLPRLRSTAIARWALAVLARPAERAALYSQREFRGPGGLVARGRFVDRLDEIQACDLDAGPRTGVRRAFERAAARLGEAHLAQVRQDLRVLASAPTRVLPRPGSRAECSAQWLLTGAELVREGDAMGHCVGGYSSAVASGASSILALCVRGQRATIEFLRDGRVAQFFGPRDGQPHALCVRWLDLFLRRNGMAPLCGKWGRL